MRKYKNKELKNISSGTKELGFLGLAGMFIVSTIFIFYAFVYRENFWLLIMTGILSFGLYCLFELFKYYPYVEKDQITIRNVFRYDLNVPISELRGVSRWWLFPAMQCLELKDGKIYPFFSRQSLKQTRLIIFNGAAER